MMNAFSVNTVRCLALYKAERSRRKWHELKEDCLPGILTESGVFGIYGVVVLAWHCRYA